MAIKEPNWSDLPEELWSAIGKRFDIYTDFLAFRSVCQKWRSSLPPFHLVSLPFPLKFPHPIVSVPLTLNFPNRSNFVISRTILYRLQPVDQKNPLPSLSETSYSSSTLGKGWLAKVEESEPGQLRLLHPLSKRQIRYNLDAFPKLLNLLDFHVLELAKSYTIKHSSGAFISGVTKIVLFPDSAWTRVEDVSVLAVFQEGKLGFSKRGDENWTLVDDRNFYYDDVIVYKGQFYVVDRWGTVSWVDSSLRLVQFSPPLCGFGSHKHLVESCGDLYVVDRFLDHEPRLFDINDNHSQAKAVDFKVYKLDQEWGRWVEALNLGDRTFILGSDCCLSVSAEEFLGCKGNCIYYTDENDDDVRHRGNGHHSRVFDLKERRIGNITSIPGYSQIFWPPPHWLTQNPYIPKNPDSS